MKYDMRRVLLITFVILWVKLAIGNVTITVDVIKKLVTLSF